MISGLLLSLTILGGFFVLFFSLKKANLDREDCYKQYIFVVQAIFYVCLVIGLLGFMASDFEENGIIFVFLQELFNYFGVAISENNLQFSFYILINCVILLGFLGLKFTTGFWVSQKHGSRLKEKTKLYSIVEVFYELEKKTVMLKPQFYLLKIFFDACFWSYMVFYSVYIVFFLISNKGLGVQSDGYSINELVFGYPVISIILINEFRYFLGGLFYQSKENMTASDIKSKPVSHYDELINDYVEIFSNQFGFKMELPPQNGLESHYNEMRIRGENEAINTLVENLMEKIRLQGLNIDPHYVTSYQELLNKNNIIVKASIYSDYKYYLMEYLNMQLTSGEKLLIICENQDMLKTVEEYFIGLFRSANHLDAIWEIRTINESRGYRHSDVIIATTQFIIDEPLLTAQKEFFENLGSVLILNTVEIISNNSFIPMLMSWKLDYRFKCKPQYIFLGEESDSKLKDCLEHIFQLNDIKIIGNSNRFRGKTDILVWKGESAKRPQDLLLEKQSSYYYSFPFVLAILAIDHGKVQKVSIQANKNMYYKKNIDNIASDSDLFKNPVAMQKNIKVDFYGEKLEEAVFLIVEDIYNNIPLTVKNYSQYSGSDNTMLHIISKPYMLRDYFIDQNSKIFNHRFLSDYLVPAIGFSLETKILNLICKAYDIGITEQEILDHKPEFMTSSAIMDILHDYLVLILQKNIEKSIYDYFTFTLTSVFNSENVCYETEYIIKLTDESLYRHILDQVEKVKIIPLNKENSMFVDIAKTQIYQNLIEEQICVFSGKTYIVEKIIPEKGIIEVENKSVKNEVPTYIQDRIYSIKEDSIKLIRSKDDKQVFGDLEHDCKLKFNISIYTARLNVTTNGYYEKDFSDNLERYVRLSDEKIKTAQRSIETNYLHLIFETDKDEEIEAIEKSLAILMNEMMKTIFPKLFQYIAVCSGRDDTRIRNEIGNYFPSLTGFAGNSGINILIIEDSDIETGSIGQIYDSIDEILTMLKEYLVWHTDSTVSVEAKQFWSGYYKRTADYLNLTRVLDLIDPLVQIERELTKERFEISEKGTCDFCGKKIFDVEYNLLEDGRIMCNECILLKVTDIDVIKVIYNKAVDYLQEEYSIIVPNNMAISFKSQEEINLKIKNTANYHTVGFADSRTRELWVLSGSPSADIGSIIVHELTHFWQYDNLIDTKQIDVNLVEGHSTYVEVEYLYDQGYKNCGDKKKNDLMLRDDEYGRGFKEFQRIVSMSENENPFDYMKMHYSV